MFCGRGVFGDVCGSKDSNKMTKMKVKHRSAEKTMWVSDDIRVHCVLVTVNVSRL